MKGGRVFSFTSFTSKFGLGVGAFGYNMIHQCLFFVVVVLVVVVVVFCFYTQKALHFVLYVYTMTLSFYTQTIPIPFQSGWEHREKILIKLSVIPWSALSLPRKGECCTYVSAVTHYIFNALFGE